MNYRNDNIGSNLVFKAGGALSAVAGGAGDNTLATGASIDTQGYGSAKFVGSILTSLASGKKLDLVVSYQLSTDGSTWGSAVTVYDDAFVTATGSAIVDGAYPIEYDFTPSSRYVRFIIKPDMNATGVDTTVMGHGVVLGGSYENPVTATV